MNRCIGQTITLALVIKISLSVITVLPNDVMANGCGPVAVFSNQIDKQLPKWMKSYAVPGVVILVLKEGDFAWKRAYGVSDVATQTELLTDAIFRVESISKPVTAWGVMRLEELGLLDIDEPVQTYLPSMPLISQITVRQMLSHQAGLPLGDFTARYDPDSPLPTLRESLTKELALPAADVGHYSYSDTGYNILELLVETSSEEDFTDFMAREILDPLDMHESTFSWEPALGSRLPKAYDLFGDPVLPYVYAGRGSGGLFATIDNIGKFMQAGFLLDHSKNRILNIKTLRTMYEINANELGLFKLVADGYGLGYFIEELSDGHTAVWHGGQGAGWMTDFHYIPDTGNGIVILSNSQRSWPVFARILRDWSQWCGIRPVGMSRVQHVETLLLFVISLTCLVAAWLAINFGVDLISGSRINLTFKSAKNKYQIGQFCIAAIIIAGLIWASFQKYLFIFSAAPTLYKLLAYSLGLLAATLVLAAVFPRRPKVDANSIKP